MFLLSVLLNTALLLLTPRSFSASLLLLAFLLLLATSFLLALYCSCSVGGSLIMLDLLLLASLTFTRVPAVVGVPDNVNVLALLASLLSLTSFQLLVFPPVLASLLLASHCSCCLFCCCRPLLLWFFLLSTSLEFLLSLLWLSALAS